MDLGVESFVWDDMIQFWDITVPFEPKSRRTTRTDRQVWHRESSGTFVTGDGRRVVSFVVTGEYLRGGRFKSVWVPTYESYVHLRQLNLWKGTVWARLEGGGRVKMWEVCNGY